MARTRTYAFGTSSRESHDATEFYSRNLYQSDLFSVFAQISELLAAENQREVEYRPREEWANQIYCHSAEDMLHIPDGSVGLAFTSPPYNVGKEFDDDLDLVEYLTLIANVGREVYRVLTLADVMLSICKLGEKTYIPPRLFLWHSYCRRL